MAFLKYAKAKVVHPLFTQQGWDEIRQAAVVPAPSFELRKATQTVLEEYDPKKYLLTHCTIVASVDTEDAGLPLGKVMVDGAQVNRLYPDFYVTAGTTKFINSNFDCFERKLLLSSFRSFVGGQNFCFLPGTMVTLSDGTQKPIEQIAVGELVLTHEGRARRVRKTFVRQVEEEVCSIYIDRYQTPVKCTKEHPFRTLSVRHPTTTSYKGSKTANQARYVRDSTRRALRDGTGPFARAILTSESWVEAGNLKRHDFLLGPKTSKQEGGSVEEATLLGYYVSEGCLQKYNGVISGVIFTFGSHEQNLAQHVKSLISVVFPGVEAKIYPSGSVIHVRATSPGVGNWFYLNGSEYSEGKRLSRQVMGWGLQPLKALLSAWLTGDAQRHGKTERLVGSSVSFDLSCQMHRICDIVGFRASLWRESDESFIKRQQSTRSTVVQVVGGVPREIEIIPKHKAYNLIVSRDHLRDIKDFTPRWENFENRRSRRRSEFHRYNGTTVHYVSWIGHEDYKGPVFNFEVEEDNSYVLGLGGVSVHNCEHVQIPELSKGRIIDAVARDIGESVYIDILVATERKHKALIEAITSGQLSTLSMGCSTTETQCTKCGNVATDETQLCMCIRFKKGTTFLDAKGQRRKVAELCGHASIEPGSVKFIEASWVANPAFKGAVLRNILDPNKAQVVGVREKIQDAFQYPTEVVDPRLVQKAARMNTEIRSGDHLVYLHDGPSLGNLRSPKANSAVQKAQQVKQERLTQVTAFEDDMGQEPAQEPAPKEPESPFKKVVEDLHKTLVDEVKDRVKKELSDNESEKTRSLLDENSSNESLIKSALKYAEWRNRAANVASTVRDREHAKAILAGMILHSIGGWEAVQKARRFTGSQILVMDRLINSSMKRASKAGESRIYRTVIAVGGVGRYANMNDYLIACSKVLGRTPNVSEKASLIEKGKLFSFGL